MDIFVAASGKENNMMGEGREMILVLKKKKKIDTP